MEGRLASGSKSLSLVPSSCRLSLNKSSKRSKSIKLNAIVQNVRVFERKNWCCCCVCVRDFLVVVGGGWLFRVARVLAKVHCRKVYLSITFLYCSTQNNLDQGADLRLPMRVHRMWQMP